MNHRASSDYDEIIGVIHLHSNYSDGEGDVDEIVEDARAVQLDYLILTDHDCAAARREGREGRQDGTTLVVGIEITPYKRPHCLALGDVDCLGLACLSEKDYLDRIEEMGGFAAIAHPEGGRKRELRLDHRPWSMWDHPAVKAVEIWNYTHDWIEDVHPLKPHKFYKYFLRPNTQITGPKKSVLERWDSRAQLFPLSCIAGLDCHARSIPVLNMQVFPYRDMFKTLRTHLFVPSGRRDPQAILDSIRGASGFVGYDYLADSTGTEFTAECECGQILGMGDIHYCGGLVEFRAALPEQSHIRLLRNGKAVADNHGRELEYRSKSPGVYRVEAFIELRAWVFTNHIYLKEFSQPEEAPNG